MNSPDSKHFAKHLEEQLNQLSEGTSAPSELKSEVFNTLDTLSLLGDVADLFTIKFSYSEALLFDAATDSFSDELSKEDPINDDEVN